MKNALLVTCATGFALLLPATASACACGCGIFDVGDGTVMPGSSDSGLTVWLRYAHMTQDQLREGGHRADQGDNPDKRIATDFYTIGGQYMINRKWTVMAQLPLVDRTFTTTDDGTYAASDGTINSRHITDLGDAMVKLTYTGLSSDMTTGIGVGVKLPTGRYTAPAGPLGGTGFDRDTLPGSGSTDLQVHAYHVGRIKGALSYFVQAQYQFAVAKRDDYRPGNEADAALGVTYDLGTNAKGLGIAPTLTLLGSVRNHDTGGNSDPLNSGYQRLLLAPGVKVHLGRKLSIYGDVEFPVAQYVRYDDPASGVSGQLTAPVQFRLQLNYAI